MLFVLVAFTLLLLCVRYAIRVILGAPSTVRGAIMREVISGVFITSFIILGLLLYGIAQPVWPPSSPANY